MTLASPPDAAEAVFGGAGGVCPSAMSGLPLHGGRTSTLCLGQRDRKTVANFHPAERVDGRRATPAIVGWNRINFRNIVHVPSPLVLLYRGYFRSVKRDGSGQFIGTVRHASGHRRISVPGHHGVSPFRGATSVPAERRRDIFKRPGHERACRDCTHCTGGNSLPCRHWDYYPTEAYLARQSTDGLDGNSRNPPQERPV
jgi:hypothetical protein